MTNLDKSLNNYITHIKFLNLDTVNYYFITKCHKNYIKNKKLAWLLLDINISKIFWRDKIMRNVKEQLVNILNAEVKPALGCTEKN